MMTNLEANKERIREGTALCVIAYLFRYGEQCTHIDCSSCEFNGNVDECIKEVLAEHKELIKLKQWEKDLLEEICYIDERFEESSFLTGMRKRGHFENVKDISMKIIEILDNCEVVE